LSGATTRSRGCLEPRFMHAVDFRTIVIAALLVQPRTRERK
jgi:hypothetical protein